MRRFGGTVWRPWLSLPIDRLMRWRAIHPFPVWSAVWGDGNVSEDGILTNRLHHIGVGFAVRSRSDAKEASLGVNSPQASIRPGCIQAMSSPTVHTL